jgi:hypothetical protein
MDDKILFPIIRNGFIFDGGVDIDDETRDAVRKTLANSKRLRALEDELFEDMINFRRTPFDFTQTWSNEPEPDSHYISRYCIETFLEERKQSKQLFYIINDFHDKEKITFINKETFDTEHHILVLHSDMFDAVFEELDGGGFTLVELNNFDFSRPLIIKEVSTDSKVELGETEDIKGINISDGAKHFTQHMRQMTGKISSQVGVSGKLLKENEISGFYPHMAFPPRIAITDIRPNPTLLCIDDYSFEYEKKINITIFFCDNGCFNFYKRPSSGRRWANRIRRKGWRRYGDEWYCPDCNDKI